MITQILGFISIHLEEVLLKNELFECKSRFEKYLLRETTPPPLVCAQLFGWNPSSQLELTSHPFLKRPSLCEFHQSESQQHSSSF